MRVCRFESLEKPKIENGGEYLKCVYMVIGFLSLILILIDMPVEPKIRSQTTALGKRGQIVGYAALHMPLKTISATTNIAISTCSDIIRLFKLQCARPNAPNDLCANNNIKRAPNCRKSDNQVLSNTQKQHVIALPLSDAAYCRKLLEELVAESQLNISTSTLRRVLTADEIHRCTATTKSYGKEHCET